MNNIKYFWVITLIAVCIIVIGKLFLPTEREEVKDESYEGQKVFVTPADTRTTPYRTYVIPVVMDDGTKCVVVAGGGGGTGISCEWRNK
jgi:hypothetical protein